MTRYLSFALFAVAPRQWDRLHRGWCYVTARWRYWRMTPDERKADTAELVTRALLFVAAWEVKQEER